MKFVVMTHGNKVRLQVGEELREKGTTSFS
jgi:hypothetical protein